MYRFGMKIMSQTQINLKTAPGHQVLAAAGKQALRPGGRTATEQLCSWAKFKSDETVLELAASFGTSAITLAKRYGVRVVGIEKNPDSVAQARINIAAAGLNDRIDIIEGDIFHLDQLTEQFDYVLAEAILTMQSAPAKAKILSGAVARLKPEGHFLSHELLVGGPNLEAIRQDLSAKIRVNAVPLTVEDWITTCRDVGLDLLNHQSGPMGLLRPQQIAREEGVTTLFTMAWNMITQPIVRQRILEMRSVFNQYQDNLGYIIAQYKKIEPGL